MLYPKVLIVTPSFNQGEYIEETIESVLSQDYPNLEYLIVDGGSTDQTISILQKYDHHPNFHWVSEPDDGQSDAIQKGFEMGDGDIIGWLCSDDIYLPNAIQSLVDVMQQKNVQCVFGDVILMDEHSHIQKFVAHGGYHPSQFKIRIPLKQPAAIWTRSLYERVGGVDLSLEQLMDRDLFWRMSKVGEFAYTPEFVCAIRMYDDAKTIKYFATLHKDETNKCAEKMGESAPIIFAEWLPKYEKYPRVLKSLARIMTKLYRVVVQMFYAPKLVTNHEFQNWKLKRRMRSKVGKHISSVISFPKSVLETDRS